MMFASHPQGSAQSRNGKKTWKKKRFSLFYALLIVMSIAASSRFIVIPQYSGVVATRRSCTGKSKKEGLIVSNMLGLLANDLFEVAFAARLKSELCWHVVYRSEWNSGFLTDKTDKCFPNALVEMPKQTHPFLRDELGITEEIYNILTDRKELLYERYDEWKKDLDDNRTFVVKHMEYPLDGNGVPDLVTKLSSPDSTIQVVVLEAFFIHYDWMKD